MQHKNTMKRIQDKYSKTQLNYINLDKLKFKVIRRKNDNFYKIVDNSKIRRNYSFNSEEIIKQSTLFDLGDLILLSKIHISDSNLMKLKIEISPNLQGPWVAVENEITIVSGKIRVLKIGSLPCRFFTLTVIKGCPIMDFSKVECFGLKINDIKAKYDDDTLDMLYYNSYDLIYRKQNTNYNSNYGSEYNSGNNTMNSYNMNKKISGKNQNLSDNTSEVKSRITNNNYSSYNSNTIMHGNHNKNYEKNPSDNEDNDHDNMNDKKDSRGEFSEGAAYKGNLNYKSYSTKFKNQTQKENIKKKNEDGKNIEKNKNYKEQRESSDIENEAEYNNDNFDEEN